MLYFYCVTQCFSLSLITHKLKLEYPVEVEESERKKNLKLSLKICLKSNSRWCSSRPQHTNMVKKQRQIFFIDAKVTDDENRINRQRKQGYFYCLEYAQHRITYLCTTTKEKEDSYAKGNCQIIYSSTL